MMTRLRIRLPLFALLALLLPMAVNPAPADFGPQDFQDVLRYARSSYLDTDSIDARRGYVEAARSAIGAMPAQLELMPAAYVNQRKEFAPFGIIIPGSVVKLPWTDKYVVFRYDVSDLDSIRDKREAAQKKQWDSLGREQREKEAIKLKEKQRQQKDAVDAMWKETGFSGSDFQKIMSWISSNRVRYGKSPNKTASTDTASETSESDDSDNVPGKIPEMNYYYFQAARGFLKSFDPHAEVMERKVWDRIRKESEDSTFDGIGAVLRPGDENEVIVESPFPGSPALRSGLKAGDIIRKVDGKSIANLSLQQVVSRIRGPRGTIVSLEVDRPTDLTTREIKIERDRIERKAVDSSYLKEENIGIIRIRSFLYHETPTTKMVKEAYADIRKEAGDKDPDGLVLDLRNNPGGQLEEAIRVSGLFLKDPEVITTLKSNRNSYDRRSDGEPMVPSNMPLIVLVDGGSASASEIMASALQDYNRALILGDRTFGKATVQQIEQMQGQGDPYLIKLTVARYYAPKGYTVQVYGVQPDIRISDQKDGEFPLRFREEDMWHHLPELKKKADDPAKEKWLESLKKQVDSKKAEEYLKAHENDAVRPDYMLQRALPYLKAMIANR
ncbi:MAG: PDZ domain-containing protein [Leptospiraceae bacterium]|nr:PDZ domain-containing protein [Leptospiraceae bacterium]